MLIIGAKFLEIQSGCGNDVGIYGIAKEENLSEKQNYADEESCVSSLGRQSSTLK